MSSNEFCVGAAVRLPRPEAPKSLGTATIATLQSDEACVLWEPLAPKPLPSSSLIKATTTKPKRRLKRLFLVTPLINSSSDNETETTTKTSALTPLLDFEPNAAVSGSLEDWKDRGDQLLKLGDPSKACSYYEMALRLSSILQVGATVIVKAGGHAKLADVDCLDDDDEDAIEISLQDSGEEKVIPETEILLCILYNDEDDHLQERILLNLARCLLQLADLAKHEEMASDRRPRYLRGAVLATTLALTIAEHHVEDNSLTTKLAQTALLLRGQAQAGLGKYQQALSDTKKLLQVAPNHKEGTKQLKNLTSQQQKQKQVDKKLVKSMCSWVQKATNDDPVSRDENSKDMTAVRESSSTPQSTAGTSKNKATNKCATLPIDEPGNTQQFRWTPPMIFFYVALPLVVAFLLQKILG